MTAARLDVNDELGVRPEMVGYAEVTTPFEHLTDAEKRRLRVERRELLARKVPLGFVKGGGR